MYFKDKVIWITGASSGIGEHLAYALAEKGARLILSSRNLSELERVKNNCNSNSEIMLQPLDVTDFDQVPLVAKKILDNFGFINILINNAGISQRALGAETRFEVDKQIMSVNYLGTIAATKSILPSMQKQQFGQIVVISSVLGKLGMANRSAYAASKHALHGFFDSLRAEVFHDNIKITLIIPGYVRTNVTFNALKGTGHQNKQPADPTSKGLHPSTFAQKALKPITAQRREVIIGGFSEVLAIQLDRFFPGLFARINRNLKME